LLLVGIVAAGLVISDVVTYNALRSFLTTREDQQLEAAAFPVGRALLSSSGLGLTVPAAPPSTSTGPTGTILPPSVRTHRGPVRGSFRDGGGLFGGSPSAQRGLLVTPGTYGQLRSASGKVEAHLFFSYGGKAPTAPTLPAKLPGAGLPGSADLFFSTTSAGPNSVSYRVVAKPLSDHTGVIVVAVPLTDLESTLRQLLLVELVISALLLVGLGIVSWVMVRRDLRPLEEIAETAGAIADGDLSQRVSHVNEATEVGQLGMAFNTMVDEIEVAFSERAASEDRLRRFLADASHELRTPLTSIRGYAELFDLGVRDRPEDLAASMRAIKEEAARMGTLVDDLLWLAQLDHERPLRREPVDLGEVAERSAAAVGVSDPGRPLTVEAGTPVVVVGDGQRLRQVVDNLLVNALLHTPEGAAVEVTVCQEGEWASLTVHDEGSGIDPADVERIFQPFYRSDPSRARASGGAGLGLAIVAAIVAAHGGTVRVLPGPGATFEVRLPMGPRKQDGPVDRSEVHPDPDGGSDGGGTGSEGASGGSDGASGGSDRGAGSPAPAVRAAQPGLDDAVRGASA
jgi:two-component system OmpR family sensor kinase